MNKDSVEAVEKILGKPVSAEFAENVLKVRRNLLISSGVSILAVTASAKLDPKASILGFKFIGLTDEMMRAGLLAATLYLLIHFVWYVFDSLLEWRLRVTGTRVAFVTGAKAGSEHADYPDDPRQSTLYSWWLDRARQLQHSSVNLTALDKILAEWEEAVQQRLKSGGDPNLVTATSSLSKIRNELFNLGTAINIAQETISAQRIPASLKRFDDWYHLFQKSQNLRWLFIDVAVPIWAGCAAVALLIAHWI